MATAGAVAVSEPTIHVPAERDTLQESPGAASTPLDTTSTNTEDVPPADNQIASWKGWAEIENDPIVFSTLLREWGVSNVQVNEVVPLDSVFEYPPQSIYGLIFLSRWAAPETENDLTQPPTGIWFANQTLSNSCATVALMNIVNNHATVNLGQPLNDFRATTMHLTPVERGLALDRFDHVRDVHNSFATEFDKMNVDLRLKQDMALAEKKKRAANAKRPRKKLKAEDEADEDESGLHFVAYVPAGGVVWRMDGLERLPRKLGCVHEEDSWVAMVLPELQAQLESATTNSLEYSLLSLTALDDSSSLDADQVKMERTREDWGPFLAQMVKVHAEKVSHIIIREEHRADTAPSHSPRNQVAMTSPLTQLPNEVIHVILSYLPFQSNTALQQTCHRFADAAKEPLVWKKYCQDFFRWWDRRHSFPEKLRDASFVAWKELFAERYRTSKATRQALNTMIEEDSGRLDSLRVILDARYDAKDHLFDMYWNAPSSPNHLAQKYWSHAALGCVQRLIAVEEWKDIPPGEYRADSLERSLSAFDMFILEEKAVGDMSDILARLDSYVLSVREAHPHIDGMSPRMRASIIAQHLLDKKWVGITDGRNYHSIDHMFLGVALFSTNRNSVPLISASIFCYVARRFNLRAEPCSFPFHVYAFVQAPLGFDIDGHPLAESSSQEPSDLTHFYMDPFHNSEPISRSVLETRLKFMNPGVTPTQTVAYMSPAPPRDLSARTALNILASPSHDPGLPLHPINTNLAAYSALFALVSIPSEPPRHATHLRQHLAVLTQHFLEYFDLDIHLFETCVLPLTNDLPDARAYRNLILQLKESDHESRPAKYRADPRNSEVKYSVGQVFRHRRRNYVAVIYGWDPYCRMQEQWITMNQVDRLPNGRSQPFYNVIVEDESTRYVAEENVVLLGPDDFSEEYANNFPIEVGKWFKRYDPETATFVSNVKDEYPDD
ncbi:hypothetical protein AYO21_01886 [Fonsecaea monophora]|uniref:ubiquitinyl hydrolase 1 n=1 Tax=Fonsecaea monophora TaxID=254056 RepID=A0A177FIE0_9EURO|nr:hypothetical protein AYO21_01886 [Fonsecaea monophora]OAG44034.1 hypothetical protein AYO21_01886 [Fonsecaea monophora]